MITLTRSLARELRAFARQVAPARAGPHPPVELVAGRDGLTARVVTGEVAVVYRRPGRLADARVLIPAAALADCEGRDDAPVTVRPLPGGSIEVGWARGGRPEVRVCPAPARADPPPPPPGRFTPADPGLLAALDAVGRTGATAATTRFALTRVQLRGNDGAVVGTDGKQLLVHRGFAFPWADAVLVARSGVFGVLAGLAPGPVGVGRTGAHVWVAAGPWAVAVAVDPKGRFPDVVEVVPRPGAEATTLTVHPADADALRAALPTLPGVDEPNRPVTLDLGGRAVVRAAGDDRARPAEFVLTRSRVDGRAVRVGCDRRHLAHALGLGFRVLRVSAPDQPVACPDGSRTFVFMPLTADAVVEPAAGATRVRPPKPAAGRAGKPAETRPGDPKSTPPPPAAVPAAPAPAGGGLVEEAVAVRDVLRATLGRIRAVIAGARRQQRQNRVVRSTLASLEQLKTRGG